MAVASKVAGTKEAKTAAAVVATSFREVMKDAAAARKVAMAKASAGATSMEVASKAVMSKTAEAEEAVAAASIREVDMAAKAVVIMVEEINGATNGKMKTVASGAAKVATAVVNLEEAKTNMARAEAAPVAIAEVFRMKTNGVWKKKSALSAAKTEAVIVLKMNRIMKMITKAITRTIMKASMTKSIRMR
jgi:hypothetical protein